MHHATLCYVFDYKNPKDVKVLLGMKKDGFGAGIINGYGGKFDSEIDKTYMDAAIRETKEEADIDVFDLEKVAEIDFKFTNAPPGKDWDQIVHVYFTKKWRGTPQNTKEMINPTWYSLKDIPYDKFWKPDKIWLPEVLDGKNIYAWFTFAEDNASVKNYKIIETTRFKR